MMSDNLQEGSIIKSLSGFYDVINERGQRYTLKPRGIFRKQKIKPQVGDLVKFHADGSEVGVLEELIPRKNSLIRPPVSNISYAIIVVSVEIPKFSTDLLDRFLVKVAENNINPIILVTKVDKISVSDLESIKSTLKYYEDNLKIPVIFKNQNSVQELKSKLLSLTEGSNTILVGQSGSGKSTFLNEINQKITLKTDDISKQLMRGKHTTRHVEIYAFDGLKIADTPGFSSLETHGIPEQNLKKLFPDLLEYSANCKFRECMHLNEPGCGVKAAVADGNILASRYDNYVQYLQEIRKNFKY